MELLIKGLLGALVAILLHFATGSSKHYFLAGMIPLFPTFALFAHVMFASSGEPQKMQTSAVLGLLSLIPYGIYLLITWKATPKLGSWLAITLGLCCWASLAALIAYLWIKKS